MTANNASVSGQIERLASLIPKARELREKYQEDPHRPAYHFVAPEGICHPFDPQGCIYWKGRYHLFYAYQVEEVGVWAHASSTDLVHWIHHPIPLGVSPGDPEEQVYAGGSLINKDGVPTMIYHGVNAGTCLATSADDGLIHWTKHPANPVIPKPKEGDDGYGKYHVWDTCGWLHEDTYYSICGNHPFELPKSDGDVAYLFRSDDLVDWEYVHPFYQSDRRWTEENEDCSCPDFFPIGDKYMLMFISHTHGTQYYLGSYDGERFVPERHARMSWAGGPLFAQESLLDGDGRRIFWAWVFESRSRNAQLSAGWAGVMSLPRVLSLGQDDTLLIEPAEELQILRRNYRRQEGVGLADGSEMRLEGMEGDCLELALEVDDPSGQKFGVVVRCSPDSEERTVILFDDEARTLQVDTSRSSLSPEVVQPWPQHGTSFSPNPLDGREDVRVQKAPFELAPGEPLRLRIFLDRSILEVFANSRQCLTQRIYPTRGDSMGVRLFSQKGRISVRSIEAWDIAAANPW